MQTKYPGSDKLKEKASAGTREGEEPVVPGSACQPFQAGDSIVADELCRAEEEKDAELARTRQELREIRERFRALSEASFGGIGIHDKGIILDCNKGLSDISGYSSEELIGMDGLMLIAPAWRERVMQNIITGYDKAYDVEGLRKDGSVYPLEIRGKNIPYHGRTVRVTEFRDITERKKADQERQNLMGQLENEHRKLETILEELPSGVTIAEAPSGRLLYHNTRAGQLLRHPLYLSRDYREYVRYGGIHSDGTPYKPEEYPVTRALSGETVHMEEVLYRRGDGTTASLTVSAAPIRDTGGNITAAVITFDDISELKRVEQDLRESEEKYRLLFESSIDGILLTKQDGTIYAANPAACRILGRTEEEIMQAGRNGITDASDPRLKKAVEERERTGSFRGELRQRRKDGTTFPVEIATSLSKGKTGETRASIIFRDITGRKQLEENLRVNEERLRLAQQAGRIGMFDLDMVTGKITFNDEMKLMIGLPPGYTGRIGNWSEYTPQEDIDAYLLRMEKTINEQGREIAGEYRVIRPDDDIRWLSSRSAIHYDESGKPVRMIGSVVDITDLKRAQGILSAANVELEKMVMSRTRELTESNRLLSEQTELLQKIIDHIPVMLILLDPQGKVRLINPEIEYRSGWSRKDVKHIDIIKASYPDPAAHKAVLDFMTGAEPGWRDFEPITKSGEKLPSSWAVVRLNDGSVMGIGIDIRERKKMENELIRLAAAIDQAGEGIILFSAGGIIEYVNPAFENLCGYGSKELMGRTPKALGEEVHEDYSEIFAHIRSDNKMWTGRKTRKRKNGERIEVYMTVSPVLDPGGKIINFVSVLRDITQEVRLQQHVSQRQKLEAIGTLAGGIAHDLKNILTPVLINTEIALEDVGDDHPARPVLEEVLEAAKMGKDLVSQILTFSKRTPEQKTPVDISALTRETLAFLRSSLSSTIEIRQHLNAECTRVLADPTQIKQVLINLGSNAGYAMKPHGGVLDITLCNAELDESSIVEISPDLNPGAYIQVEIRDTGQGMDEQTLEHIFEPFFTTKPKGEGTGMGLAIAHGIIRNHQGAITARSKPGEGSSFTVYLPMAKDECAKDSSGTAATA